MKGTIEVLGLPGSGKTTLVREVARSAIATTTDWAGPVYRSRLPVAARLFLSAPVFSATAYLLLLTRSHVTWVAVRRVLSVQRRLVLMRQPNGLRQRVLDEGPVHALYIALYGTSATRFSGVLLRAVLRTLASSVDHYVYMDTPKEQCISNFASPDRTSVRFNHQSGPAAIELFRRDSTYEEILGGLRCVAGSKVHVVPDVDTALGLILAE